MEVKLIMKSARNAVIEIADGGIYNTKETYHVLLNGEEVFSTDTVINSLFDLKPQTSYEVSVRTADGTELGTVSFVTAYEFVTLNVRVHINGTHTVPNRLFLLIDRGMCLRISLI